MKDAEKVRRLRLVLSDTLASIPAHFQSCNIDYVDSCTCGMRAVRRKVREVLEQTQ